MADTTPPADTLDGIVTAIKEFAVSHQGTMATVEYEARRGARVVLRASDGASAETFAPATDIAREACREAGVALVNTWEQELFAEIRAQATVW